MPVTQNEPIFSVSTSPNSTEITKLILNNNTSICLCIVFAMTSKVRKKLKNFKINRKGGRFSKNTKKAEDFPLYRKTWQVCNLGPPFLLLHLTVSLATHAPAC